MRIAENLLLYQRDVGGWDKNIDMALALGPTDARHSRRRRATPHRTPPSTTTAPTRRLRYLARVYTATHQRASRPSFRRGFEYLLKAQYPNGGWPQFYPLREGYWSHITYNDDAMVGVLELMRDVAGARPDFAFLGRGRPHARPPGHAKGIECILKTQIVQDGKLTVWCAQHDERTLAPAKARAYELPSFSGSESVGIVRFLMGIEEPSPEVVTSHRGCGGVVPRQPDQGN